VSDPILLRQCIQDELCRRNQRDRRYQWLLSARSSQLPPPGNWRYWLILAGRGFGKTRTGSETIRLWVEQNQYKRIALIGQNLSEVRQVMVEGPSGLLACYPPHQAPRFFPSKRLIQWNNQATATLYGADHVDRLRGPQFDLAWIDELCKFRTASALWEQLMLGLRLGKNPRCILTTTPRPIPLLEYLIQNPETVVTTGTTFDNADHLAPSFLT
jgi:phage terminase large subunit-like protein